MQRLEVSGAVRPVYGSLDVKRLNLMLMALVLRSGGDMLLVIGCRELLQILLNIVLDDIN